MNELIKETLKNLEQLITEKGYQKIESKIKLHEFGGKKYLLIDDVLSLCHDIQSKYKNGTERGYLNLSEQERNAIVWAIYRLRTLFISDDLSKANSFEEHKAILTKYFKKEGK